MKARADDARRRTILAAAIAFTALCIACSSLGLVAALLARRREATAAAQSPAVSPAETTPAMATEPLPAVLTEQPAAELPLPTPSFTAEGPIWEATATPAVLRGKGDEKVDLEREREPSIAHISHEGSGHFSVINYDSDGKRIGLLVNTTGAYDGVVPIDFAAGEHTARFRVEADGEWTIKVLDLLAARAAEIPGDIEGEGDEVIVLGGSPHVATIEVPGDGNFALWSYGSGYDLVVNEMAPYQGSVVLDPHAFFLVIGADGPWSLSVTARE
jgi:hypothetical protein